MKVPLPLELCINAVKIGNVGTELINAIFLTVLRYLLRRQLLATHKYLEI